MVIIIISVGVVIFGSFLVKFILGLRKTRKVYEEKMKENKEAEAKEENENDKN